MQSPTSLAMDSAFSRWNSFQRMINFRVANSDHSSLQSLFEACMSSCASRISAAQSYCSALEQHFAPMVDICKQSKFDIADAIVTQYQQSNLSCISQFLARCKLFHSPSSPHSVSLSLTNANSNTSLSNHSNSSSSSSSNDRADIQQMFEHYISCYSSCIAKPLRNVMSASLAFKDDMSICVAYLTRLYRCVDRIESSGKHPNLLLDCYIVPPSSSNNLSGVDMRGCSVSSLQSRNHDGRAACALDDVEWLFERSEQVQRMLNHVKEAKHKRMVLVIVRQHAQHTMNDTLYLYTQRVVPPSSLTMHNAHLWNMVSTAYAPSRFALNVSCHITKKKQANRMYVFYQGFGGRVLHSSALLQQVAYICGQPKIDETIHERFVTECRAEHWDAQREADIRDYLLCLRYTSCSFDDATQRRLLEFPKEVLRNETPDTREFVDPQKYLYYFLSWTCKMQVIDGQFLQYKLNLEDGSQHEVAIFCSELHEKYSNDMLYVVAMRNRAPAPDRHGKIKSYAKWRMDSMMTAHEIYREFAIDADSLPQGSRALHQQFQSDISRHNISLSMHAMQPVRNARRLPLVYSQKFANGRPNLKEYDINRELAASIARIQNRFDALSVIPILTIDTQNHCMSCDALIPIRAPNDSKSYYAVAYKVTDEGQLRATALYIDVNDMLNKATLVDPYAYSTFRWLHGEEDTQSQSQTLKSRSDVSSTTSSGSSCGPSATVAAAVAAASRSYSSLRSHDVAELEAMDSHESAQISDLRKQLSEALAREQLLHMMYQTRSNPSPMPSVSQMHIQVPPPPPPSHVLGTNTPPSMPATPTPMLHGHSSAHRANGNSRGASPNISPIQVPPEILQTLNTVYFPNPQKLPQQPSPPLVPALPNLNSIPSFGSSVPSFGLRFSQQSDLL